jgi:hypothetical protein
MTVYSDAERPRSWFRALWNQLRPAQAVAPDQPCLIEPSTQEYVFAYGIIEFPGVLVDVETQGWASTYHDICGDPPGGTRRDPGVVVGQQVLRTYDVPVGPSYTYPGGVYKNGVLCGLAPVQGPTNYYIF